MITVSEMGYGYPPPAQAPGTSASGSGSPLPGASFGVAVKRFFTKYATFSGRASRSEYWWAILFVFLVSLIPTILLWVGIGLSAAWALANPRSTVVGYDSSGSEVVWQSAPGLVNAPMASLMWIGLALGVIVWLATIVPLIAVNWRRMHDSGLSGAFTLLVLIPGVGGLILLVLALRASDPAGSRFDATR